MSFSGEVKRELADIVPEGRHCQIAELAAIYALAGDRMGEFADDMLANAGEIPILRTENAILQRKFFTLYEKAFMMGEVGNSRRQMSAGGSVAEAFFRAVRHPMLLKRECCRRSFLRGAFLAAGSISDPKKHYHYEIVCPDGGTAARVREVLTGFGLDAKTVRRKQSEVVYLKEGDQIVYAVGEMGASKALLELENVRIYHELRGMVNRQVNCDVANARKSAEMSTWVCRVCPYRCRIWRGCDWNTRMQHSRNLAISWNRKSANRG